MKIKKGLPAPPTPYIIFFIMADVNECSPSHDCEQICINSNGGFNCSCTALYVLAKDGRSCEGNTNLLDWLFQCNAKQVSVKNKGGRRNGGRRVTSYVLHFGCNYVVA